MSRFPDLVAFFAAALWPMGPQTYADAFGMDYDGNVLELDEHDDDEVLDGTAHAQATRRVLGGTI